MWAAGILASVSSITYPAISAFVSMHSDADKQGLVQGMVTGMRGLCNGLGPAMFGVIFYLFHVDLNDDTPSLPLKPLLSEVGNRTGSATHVDVVPQVFNEEKYFLLMHLYYSYFKKNYFYSLIMIILTNELCKIIIAVGTWSPVCFWIVTSNMRTIGCCIYS